MLHYKKTWIDLNSVVHFLATLIQRASNSLRFCQKTVGSRTEPLHVATDFKPKPVRENAHFTGLFANRVQCSKQPKLQSTVTIELMMGQ